MSDSLRPYGLHSPWNSPGKNTAVGSLFLLQEIFPTRGSNPDLLHCRRILYQLSHKGSPRILEGVVYPFSSSSSRPRNWTRVSCSTGRFFTNWAIREAQRLSYWVKCQRKTGIIWCHLYIESKKKKKAQMNPFTKEKHSHRHRGQMYGYQRWGQEW